jgi:hypothetical protein
LAAEVRLTKLLLKAGFDAYVDIKGGKISGNRCSFKIIPSKVCYNVTVYSNGKTRRCRTPRWEQRVQFNNIVNDVFDYFNIQAKIVSGAFLVRDIDGSKNENDWLDQVYSMPSYMHLMPENKTVNGLGQTYSTLIQEVK